MQQYTELDDWQSLGARRRCAIVAAVAARIAATAETLCGLCRSEQRTDPVETVAAELLPLCSALRYIGRCGPSLLRVRRCGWSGRPAWLWGVQSHVHRVPHGSVLILGTWNYPLLLPGVQAAQALAAGNRVLLKPAPGVEPVTTALVRAFLDAGVPGSCLQQLDSSTAAAVQAIDEGVDLIVLTGAASTGRQVLHRAAETLTPTIMELSGCDAAVLLGAVFDEPALLSRAVAAIGFGLTVNGGATCIAPRRLIVEEARAERLIDALRSSLQSLPPVIVHPSARQAAVRAIGEALQRGAVDRFDSFDGQECSRSGRLRPVLLDRVRPGDPIASADLFAPVTSVIRVDRIEEAVAVVNDCPYRLAASVFGPASEARSLASRLRVGSVAINDLIAPTADPRLPFGGRGQSGFGVTRGAEGLLAMTTTRVISQHRSRIAVHLQPRRPSDATTLLGALQLFHAGTLAGRLAGMRRIVAPGRTVSPPGPSASQLPESSTTEVNHDR